MSESRVSRRELAKGALALAVLPACGTVEAIVSDAGRVCGSEHGTREEGWISFALADHPALERIGGSSVVKDSATLTQAIVMQTSPGCFKAVWEICPHGSCEVEWRPDQGWLECPCHGSRFTEDGALLQGPATQPLKAFPVVRDGDVLWLKRR